MMEETDKLSNFNILLQFPGNLGAPRKSPKSIRQQQQEPIVSRNCRITFDSIMTIKMNKN